MAHILGAILGIPILIYIYSKISQKKWIDPNMVMALYWYQVPIDFGFTMTP
jgi:hypothetical protein